MKLKELIHNNSLLPKKSLGQNFILDFNILNKIAKTLLPLNDCHIIEIGPGPGGLTRSILQHNPKKLIAIEKDNNYKRILLDLCDEFKDKNILIILEDFLKVDLRKFNNKPLKIYSNLPYYISTQILMKILPLNEYNIKEVIFTFQREVAERIIAPPKSKNYSKISVLCQYACNVKRIFNLPAKVFYPVPKVDSSVLKFIPNNDVNIDTFAKLQKITSLAFGKRRKFLSNSLSKFSNISELLNKINVKKTARAEDLTVSQFVHLSEVVNL